MATIKLKCWQCGSEYELDRVDYIASRRQCPKCGASEFDAKPSRRIGQKIGVFTIIGGSAISLLPFVFQSEPSIGQFLAGLVIAGVGFLICVFSFSHPIE